MMTWGVRVEPSPPSPPEDSSGLPAQGTKILAVDSADETAPPVPSEVSPLPPEEAVPQETVAVRIAVPSVTVSSAWRS